jgi:hypothetical protein
MKRKAFLTGVTSLFQLVSAKCALADDGAVLGGSIVNVLPNEYQISNLKEQQR